ncbi:DCL family protein [Plantibacter sp. Mn2098]|uniref:DCL family protein n=1 Tax=Plantibacter sp. Mn2098 TaxID=3395266 RepID=UPI003BCB16AB
MVAKPVVLRTFRWDTISAAKAAFKAILHAYDLDERVSDPLHEAMLRELLEQHQRAQEKTGVGVDSFYIGRTEQLEGSVRYWSGRGIWIRRVDGTTADFGYNAAIAGPSPKVDVKDALRHAVSDRRDRYRESQFVSGSDVTCVLSGEVLDEADAQVIYVDPAWEQLTYRFAQSEGGWECIEVSSGEGDVQIGGRIADPDVLSRWLEFFDAQANFALASRSQAARRPWPDETAWDPAS